MYGSRSSKFKDDWDIVSGLKKFIKKQTKQNKQANNNNKTGGGKRWSQWPKPSIWTSQDVFSHNVQDWFPSGMKCIMTICREEFSYEIKPEECPCHALCHSWMLELVQGCRANQKAEMPFSLRLIPSSIQWLLAPLWFLNIESMSSAEISI